MKFSNTAGADGKDPMPESKDTRGDSDAAAVAAVLAGDRDAFAALAERYAAPLAALAYDRLGAVPDAQDAVQETLVVAFERLSTLRDPTRFGAWMYEILRNLCALRIRRKSVERVHGRRIAEERSHIVSASPLDRMVADERLVHLREAVSELSPSLREAVVVRYLGGARRREAAAILELSQEAFDKRIERALRELRERLKDA